MNQMCSDRANCTPEGQKDSGIPQGCSNSVNYAHGALRAQKGVVGSLQMQLGKWMQIVGKWGQNTIQKLKI